MLGKRRIGLHKTKKAKEGGKMKIGTLVEYKKDYNLRDAGKGLVIGSEDNETYVYWQNESRCTWVMTEWLKEMR